MSSDRRITRITVTAELSDGSVMQFRADDPFRAECEITTPGMWEPLAGGLEAFCVPRLPEPVRVKVEFSAGLRSPLVAQTSEDPTMNILNDFCVATGWTWDEVRAKAAAKRRIPA